MSVHSTLSRALAAVGLLTAFGSADALDMSTYGNLHFDTDVAQVAFTLSGGTGDVKIWTDSWWGGVNFDPVAALWQFDGRGYSLVAQNDDYPFISARQTTYDAGMIVDYLPAGQYVVTVGAYPNYAYGATLADGFVLSQPGNVSQALSDWCQPGSADCSNEKGTLWRLSIEGVDGAAPPAVPEPSTAGLLAAGLLGLALTRRAGVRSRPR